MRIAGRVNLEGALYGRADQSLRLTTLPCIEARFLITTLVLAPQTQADHIDVQTDRTARDRVRQPIITTSAGATPPKPVFHATA